MRVRFAGEEKDENYTSFIFCFVGGRGTLFI